MKTKKVKGRMNCYSAYLKAELANRKINKVWSRDVSVDVNN